MLRHALVLACGIALGAGGLFGWQALRAQHAQQPYAGQGARAVSSLSAGDIEALKKGAGWGLAKPAELNGYPGPAHVLELADRLDLTDQQLRAMREAFARMNARARRLGTTLIDAERALDQAFRTGNADDALLSARLGDAERARAALRQVHLATHLEVAPVLTDEQKRRYAELRGYGEGGHSAHGGH